MKPKTREQNFLAKIAGDTNADLTMVPRTAEEYFLNQIAENGGGSSLPSYSSSDIGKVLTIGEGGETVEPKWEAERWCGYDLVLQVNCGDEGNYINITSIKGTIEDITQKILDAKPINTYVYSLYKSNDGSNINLTSGLSTIEYYVEGGEPSGVTVKYISNISGKYVSPNYLISGKVEYIVYDGENWIVD